MSQRFSDRRNLILALIVVGTFIMLAVIGPVFFSKPPHLGAQLFVSVLAFVTFCILAGFHLAPNSKFSGWIIPAVFVLGYVVFFALRDGDFRPDQHWFVMSPLGYVAGALALGVPARPQRKSHLATQGALVLRCWSTSGEVEPPEREPTALLDHLDGYDLTLIRLRRGPRCLEVAGGLHGHLVVYYSDDYEDDEAWSAFTPSPSAGTEEQLMYVGDIQGYVQERLWCSVEQVRPLISEFTAKGRIDARNDFHWANDGVMAGGMRPSLPR